MAVFFAEDGKRINSPRLALAITLNLVFSVVSISHPHLLFLFLFQNYQILILFDKDVVVACGKSCLDRHRCYG